MGKPVLITDGVFLDILQKYDSFLIADDILGIEQSDAMKQCITVYKDAIDRDKLTYLAKVEETIIQLRCKEVAKREFKLSVVNGYIYARSPFYKTGMRMKDIRVVVCKTGVYDGDIDDLFKNMEFVLLAKEKLITAIDEQIKSNLSYINFYGKIDKKNKIKM